MKKLPASLLIIIVSYFLVSLALIATSAAYSEILVDTLSFYSGLIFMIFAVLLWVGMKKVRTIAIVLSSILLILMLVILVMMILGKMSISLTVDMENLSLPVGIAIIYTALLLLISFMGWQLRALFSHEVKKYFGEHRPAAEQPSGENTAAHHSPGPGSETKPADPSPGEEKSSD